MNHIYMVFEKAVTIISCFGNYNKSRDLFPVIAYIPYMLYRPLLICCEKNICPVAVCRISAEYLSIVNTRYSRSSGYRFHRTDSFRFR